MSEHTPGPWSTTRHPDRIVVTAPNRGTIGYSEVARVVANRRGAHRGGNVTYYFDRDAEANARLIAAAPALLAALEEIAKGEGPYSRDPLTHAANTVEAMEAIAKAAIALATGSEGAGS